jgi:hypothetical protein
VRLVPDLEHFVTDGMAAFKEDRIEDAFPLCSEEIVITQPPDIPDSATYRGHAGLVEAFRDWPSQWDQFDVDIVATEVLDERCILAHTRHRMKARDLDMEGDVWNLHVIEDDKMTRWHMFFTREQALAAARELELA